MEVIKGLNDWKGEEPLEFWRAAKAHASHAQSLVCRDQTGKLSIGKRVVAVVSVMVDVASRAAMIVGVARAILLASPSSLMIAGVGVGGVLGARFALHLLKKNMCTLLPDSTSTNDLNALQYDKTLPSLLKAHCHWMLAERYFNNSLKDDEYIETNMAAAMTMAYAYAEMTAFINVALTLTDSQRKSEQFTQITYKIRDLFEEKIIRRAFIQNTSQKVKWHALFPDRSWVRIENLPDNRLAWIEKLLQPLLYKGEGYLQCLVQISSAPNFDGNFCLGKVGFLLSDSDHGKIPPEQEQLMELIIGNCFVKVFLRPGLHEGRYRATKLAESLYAKRCLSNAVSFSKQEEERVKKVFIEVLKTDGHLDYEKYKKFFDRDELGFEGENLDRIMSALSQSAI